MDTSSATQGGGSSPPPGKHARDEYLKALKRVAFVIEYLDLGCRFHLNMRLP